MQDENAVPLAAVLNRQTMTMSVGVRKAMQPRHMELPGVNIVACLTGQYIFSGSSTASQICILLTFIHTISFIQLLCEVCKSHGFH